MYQLYLVSLAPRLLDRGGTELHKEQKKFKNVIAHCRLDANCLFVCIYHMHCNSSAAVLISFSIQYPNQAHVHAIRRI